MSLAKAVYLARISKAPQVINVWRGSGSLEQKLRDAEAEVINLRKQNIELRGKIGGLTTRIASLSKPSQRGPEAPPVFMKISDIAEVVSREFRIAVIDMQSERRTRDAVRARQVAMYLARKFSNRSFPTISRYFGNRDHTTAMHAVQKISEVRAVDSLMDAAISRVENILAQAKAAD